MKNKLLILILCVGGSIFAQNLPEMVVVEGGTFVMGDDKDINGVSNESPSHSVTLAVFQIAKTETTVLQWKAYCEDTGRKMPAPPEWGWIDNHPMVKVSWEDVINYCYWLSDKTGKIYRLPTEAEWEYAAKGGSKSKNYIYSGGYSVDLTSWYKENSGNETKPVAQKSANELGLYDMSGNVWEWCYDWYGNYRTGTQNYPMGPETGRDKVLRGGSWYNGCSQCRVLARYMDAPQYFNSNRGFRVVCSVQ